MAKVNRAQQVQTWMNSFKEIHPQVRYVTNIEGIPIAEFIDSNYWHRLEESVRQYMVEEDPASRVNRHKVASLYESMIAHIQPILPEDGDDEFTPNPLNFVFAYFVAEMVIDTFNLERGLDISYRINDEFDREHLALLSLRPNSDSFVFANAASWALREMYCSHQATCTSS